MRKEIMIFVDKISNSGASKIVCWLANKLSLAGYTVTLITYLPGEDKKEISEDIKRINLNVNVNRFIRPIVVINRLRKIIKCNKYNLCIAFLPIESMYTIISAFGTNSKTIVCERSDPYFENSIPAKLARSFYKFSTGSVFQTKEARDYFSANVIKNSSIIPNPSFQRSFDVKAYNQRSQIITYAGRLYLRQKRQDILLKAFKLIIDSGYDCELHIMGDGPDKTDLQFLAESLNISDKVKFLGDLSNVEEELSDSKLFMFSSDYEGIPNAIIEALQLGVPVVSTDCSPGGARVLIKNGFNGFIVPREDYKKLARRAIEILSCESMAETMSKNALTIVDIYSESFVLKKWLDYIEKII